MKLPIEKDGIRESAEYLRFLITSKEAMVPYALTVQGTILPG